ncbi:MAG: class I SAM-dependent methyltransferase, partial [Pedobacter sp.]
FLSMREAATLYHFATTVPHGGTIVEIGSWKGKSTYCLARGLKKGKVFAIDPFDASGEGGSAEIYQQGQGNQPLLKGFKNHMRKLRVLGKINILKGYSKDFVNQIDQINLLFIDGDHSQEGAEFDFRSYSPAIANGGYLLFHDYDASRKELGPTWVIENFVVPSNEYEFIGLFDSLWVGRKL